MYKVAVVSAADTNKTIVSTDASLRIIDIATGSSSEDEIELPNKSNPIHNTPVTTPSSTLEVIDMSEAKEMENTNNAETFQNEKQEIQNNSDSVDVDDEETSLFPHKVGIRNHALNCYASALISCLYNIPVVQMAVFDEVSRSNLRKEESVTAALATIFYKMRFGKSFIDLEPFFMPTVKKTLGWEFGGLECVLEFWNQLSTALPESLFQIELQENRFRKDDNVLIKSVSQKTNLILVSPSEKYRNIEEFLENNFVDEDAEDFIIEAKDKHEYPQLFKEDSDAFLEDKVRITSKTSLTILNCPKVLIFGIKRVRWNPQTGSSEFHSTHLGFPEKLTINGEEYMIVGNVEYDSKKVHYFAQNHDLLDDQWYTHDDKIVSRIPDTEEAFDDLTSRFIHNSSMVFYVKSSLLDEFQDRDSVEIPNDVITKLTSRNRSATLKRKNIEEINKEIVAEIVEEVSVNEASKAQEEAEAQEEEKVVKTVKKVRGPYKKRPKTQVNIDINPSITKNQKEVQNSAVKTEENITQTSMESATNNKVQKQKKMRLTYDLDGTNFFRSSFGPVADFRLGSKPFLFSKDDRNTVLEPILMAFAFHPKAVIKLFESARTKSPNDFEFKFALTVLRILIGHMAVNTKELTRDLIENYQIDFSDFATVWRRVSQLLSQEISPSPDLKIVSYKDDEPMTIENIPNCDCYSLKPFKNLKCPRQLKFTGAAYDLIEDRNENLVRRNILKSDGVILSIPVTRLVRDLTTNTTNYDSNPIQINNGPYLVYGFIGIDPDTRGKFAVFSDLQGQERFLIYTAGLPIYKQKSPELADKIVNCMTRQSVLFFLTKAEDFNLEMPKLSDVPSILLDEMALTN